MSVTFQQKCQTGLCLGAAIAVVPAVVTFTIASLPIIVINMIANAILRVLTGGLLRIRINAGFIQVPFLWQVSLVTGIIGGTVLAINSLILLSNAIYRRKFDPFAPCFEALIENLLPRYNASIID